MKDQVKAVLLALAAVLLWSTAGSAFKLTLRYASPIAMLLVSAGVATLALGMMTAMSGLWGKAFALKPRQWAMSALKGFLNPFLYYAILFVAYDRLLAQEALVLNYLWPVILVLLSIPMLKQKVAWFQWGGIIISFTGTLIIATQGDLANFRFTDAIGVALAAGSALIWALYWIFNIKDSRSGLPKLFLNFCFGWAYILIYFLVSGSTLPADVRAWGGSLYIGLFEMGITFALWLGALGYARNTASVSNLIFLSPVLSLVWVHLTVGESILSTTIWGLVLILAGIGLSQRKSKKSSLV